jgi:hypothetical protein
MNSRQLNIILLAINFGLLGTIGAMLYWLKDLPSPRPGVDRVTVVENTVTQRQVLKFNPTNLLEELTKRRVGWAAIESTNYLLYINNLRSIGCPEETIRDIILTDIAKLYLQRRAQTLAQARPFEYWRTVPEGKSEFLNDDLEQQVAVLDKERNKLVRTLLGVDFETEMAKYMEESTFRERVLSFLDADKRHQVLALLNSFEEMERQIHQRSEGVLLPADEVQLRALEQQKQEELAKILSPEELATYELNASPLASKLRYQLFGFEPSPEEFQEIYRLRKTFSQVVESSLDENAVTDPEVRERAIQDAETVLDKEMKKALGDQRYAQYERAQDPDYQFLLKWTDRMQLPQDLAAQVYTMKRQAAQQRERIENNSSLTLAQRQRARQDIARETENSLTRLLGSANFQQYRQSGGRWVDKIRQADDYFEVLPLEPPGGGQEQIP